MKKLMATLVLFCLLFSMCSCKNINDSERLNEQTNNFADSKNTENQNEEYPSVSFYSEEEYNNFIRSQKLPKNFVTYDKLSMIGDFDSLVILSVSKGDYSSYMYSFIDASGHELTLYVNHDLSKSDSGSETSLTKKPITVEINSKDMRKIDGENSGFYEHKGFIYKYVSGKLLSVVWVSEGVEYTLCGSMMLSDYPDNRSTFVGKLLNLQTASATLDKHFDVSTK